MFCCTSGRDGICCLLQVVGVVFLLWSINMSKRFFSALFDWLGPRFCCLLRFFLHSWKGSSFANQYILEWNGNTFFYIYALLLPPSPFCNSSLTPSPCLLTSLVSIFTCQLPRVPDVSCPHRVTQRHIALVWLRDCHQQTVSIFTRRLHGCYCSVRWRIIGCFFFSMFCFLLFCCLFICLFVCCCCFLGLFDFLVLFFFFFFFFGGGGFLCLFVCCCCCVWI